MLDIVVKKFGGTSLASIDLIKKSAIRIKLESTKHTIVVVSAMAGVTDNLCEMTKQFTSENEISQDMIIASGEQVSSGLFALALNSIGVPAYPLCGWQVPIYVDSKRIIKVKTKRLISLLKNGYTPVVTGFQGLDADNNVGTLPRGGSDTTAVAIAAALNAECYIYTDVDGVYNVDPNVDTNAQIFKFEHLEYTEMLKISAKGAKVLHYDAISIAEKYKIRLHVLSAFNDNLGTVIN